MSTESDHDLLVRIDSRVANLEKTLLGNGQPGWCQARLVRIEAIESAQARTSSVVTFIGWIVGILATAASAVVAVFLRQR